MMNSELANREIFYFIVKDNPVPSLHYIFNIEVEGASTIEKIIIILLV